MRINSERDYRLKTLKPITIQESTIPVEVLFNDTINDIKDVIRENNYKPKAIIMRYT